jgi:hypothetical protein
MKYLKNNFDILLILARPAAGKSEIIHYLKGLNAEERSARFHVGKMHVIDDFPILWTWFEEDDLLTRMGFPRLYTDQKGYFLKQYYWDLLIERMNLDYTKLIRDDNEMLDKTVILEFSRGKEHGGYKSAFSHISEIILQKAAILYVNVSWEESLRKNRLRFNPDKPDSTLEHSLSDEKMTGLYHDIDWDEMSSNIKEKIQIGSISIPFVNFENEDDVTTGSNSELDKRLESALNTLWNVYKVKKIQEKNLRSRLLD